MPVNRGGHNNHLNRNNGGGGAAVANRPYPNAHQHANFQNRSAGQIRPGPGMGGPTGSVLSSNNFVRSYGQPKR